MLLFRILPGLFTGQRRHYESAVIVAVRSEDYFGYLLVGGDQLCEDQSHGKHSVVLGCMLQQPWLQLQRRVLLRLQVAEDVVSGRFSRLPVTLVLHLLGPFVVLPHKRVFKVVDQRLRLGLRVIELAQIRKERVNLIVHVELDH